MTVARLFNAVGARQASAYGMVLPRFVRQALAGDDLTVYGNGTQTRCFTHVKRHGRRARGPDRGGRGHRQRLQRRRLRVGGDHRARPASDRAHGLQLEARASSRTRSAYGEGFEELGGRRPDCSAIERLTGWKPRRSIDEAIDDVIAWERRATVPPGEPDGRGPHATLPDPGRRLSGSSERRPEPRPRPPGHHQAEPGRARPAGGAAERATVGPEPLRDDPRPRLARRRRGVDGRSRPARGSPDRVPLQPRPAASPPPRRDRPCPDRGDRPPLSPSCGPHPHGEGGIPRAARRRWPRCGPAR